MLRWSFHFIMIFAFFSGNVSLLAQQDTLKKMQPAVVIPLNTLPAPFPGKKFWRAGGELLLTEVTPWVIDKYIRHVDYTNISLHTLGYNINPGNWSWDGDGFTTNQFGHPYHGSFYFNAFRTNGYNFWQSSLAVVTGSYIWETVAENQAPAPNDLINTSFGGIVLGEMIYRLSNRILNNRMNGRKKQVANIAATLVNPMGGLNRILDGKWNAIPGKTLRDTTPVSTEFDFGIRKFRANNVDNNFIFFGRIRLTYGSVYEHQRTPFSNIFINMEFGNDDSAKINIVSIYGSLKGWQLSTDNNKKVVALLTANYDFIKNEAFFYSAQSVRLTLHSLYKTNAKINMNTAIGGGLLLLSAVPDKYGYKDRYYDYCWGFGANGSFTLSIADRLFGGINYRGGWLKTVSGNARYYLLHTINGEVRYNVVRNISMCAEPGYFTLKGFYRQYDNVNKTYPYLRISLRYSFGID